MRLLVSFLFCLLLLFGCVHPKVLVPKEDGVDPLTCIKCEIVVQVFHFLNDAILGGEGEEELRQTLLNGICKDSKSLAEFCKRIKDKTYWDTIYKALRDSLETFYNLVGVSLFGCPDLKTMQHSCEA